ncbi:MAG: cohesin domain-containing protein [Thermoanaerobaculia bacterium]
MRGGVPFGPSCPPKPHPLKGRTARVLLLAVLALALLLTACGGGGGGGTPTAPPPPPVAGIAFTAQAAPGANSLYLASGAATTATTLVLEVRANQVTDLYGVAFDLTYPATQLQFVRATAGPLLSNGAVQAATSSPGTLIVGGTHLGSTPGANGSGVVLTLEFSAAAAGSGSFAFARNSALNSTGATISGLTWLAGSVTVTK